MKEVNKNRRLAYEYEECLEDSSKSVNNVVSKFTVDSYKQYVEEISNFPKLRIKEENKLLKKIALGDEQAKNDLITSKLKTVISIASKFKTEIPLMDLIQEGNLAIMEAIEKFDSEKGISFHYFSGLLINQRINKYIVDMEGLIKISYEQKSKLEELKADIEQTRMEENKNLTMAEIASILDIDLDLMFSILSIPVDVLSLEYKLDGESQTLFNSLPSDYSLEKEAISNVRVDKMIPLIKMRLSDRDFNIISDRLGLKDGVVKTQKEIAKEHNLSAGHVGQIERKTLEKVRSRREVKAWR